MAYIDQYGVQFTDDKKVLLKCPKDFQGAYTIPDSVTEIGLYAFQGCSCLTSIEIPDSVTEIGLYAFQGCSCLTSIEIPDSVTKIGESAFQGCTSLPITDSIRYADTYLIEVTDKSLSTYTIKEGTKFIGTRSFKDCSTLTLIEIPDSVTRIYGYAFQDCIGLRSIEIPNSVTAIESEVFQGCTGMPIIDNIRYADTYLIEVTDKSLSTYTIQAGIKFIGTHAFKNCSNLTSVEIPNSVMDIGMSAFEGCFSLKSIEIPNSVMRIGAQAFDGCSNLTSIEIPNSVTEISDGAFSGCTGLTSIEIPNSVTEVGIMAFFGCINLTSIEIPNSVTEIWLQTFDGCVGLTSIKIPNSVTTIGDYAFHNCRGLIAIEIPSSVTEIGVRAFDGCQKITQINIPRSVTVLGEGVFANISSNLEIIVDVDNPNYCSIDGSLFTKDLKHLIHQCSKGKQQYTTPNDVEIIGNTAFEWSDLQQIILSEGVAKIEYDAFWCMHIPSVTIPSTIQEIGKTAFKNCGTTEIHIRHTDPTQIKVAEDAFDGCAKHCTLYVPIGTGYAYRHHSVFGKFKEVIIEK